MSGADGVHHSQISHDLGRPSWWVERAIWLVVVVATISFQLAQYPTTTDVQKMIDQSLAATKHVDRDEVQKMIDVSLQVANSYLERAEKREIAIGESLVGLRTDMARQAEAVEQIKEKLKDRRR